jgi:hypothetical protein
MMKEIFASIEIYLRDVFKMASEEKFAGKVAESVFSLFIDAYIERLIIAIN